MDQEQSPRWRFIRRVPVSAWIAGGSILVLVLILIGYAFGKTLWDWLELLIVPAVIAGGVVWFDQAQKNRERGTEKVQKERQNAIEEQRRRNDREIAEQRAQDAALQSYLDHMSQLLIDKEG